MNPSSISNIAFFQFILSNEDSNSSLRSGKLVIKNKVVETPALILSAPYG
jgi:hypothetical protein